MTISSFMVTSLILIILYYYTNSNSLRLAWLYLIIIYILFVIGFATHKNLSVYSEKICTFRVIKMIYVSEPYNQIHIFTQNWNKYGHKYYSHIKLDLNGRNECKVFIESNDFCDHTILNKIVFKMSSMRHFIIYVQKLQKIILAVGSHIMCYDINSNKWEVCNIFDDNISFECCHIFLGFEYIAFLIAHNDNIWCIDLNDNKLYKSLKQLPDKYRRMVKHNIYDCWVVNTNQVHFVSKTPKCHFKIDLCQVVPYELKQKGRPIHKNLIVLYAQSVEKNFNVILSKDLIDLILIFYTVFA
eukprot:127746_1